MPQVATRGTAATRTLTVHDLGRALGYYESILGFTSAAGGQDAESAVVRGHGTSLRLRQAPTGRLVPSSTSRDTPDLTVHVPQPDRVRRFLDARLADLVEADAPHRGRSSTFDVVDCEGHTLRIAPTPGRWGRLNRPLVNLLDHALIRLGELRRRREERTHLEEFRAFYDRLENQKDVFYLFFSEGLLHWVRKALSYIPDDVNVVLLGSALPGPERAWLESESGRPFHHIRLRVDDLIAWEFLFAVNRHNFGWVDSDCLVLNGDLFHELADIGSGDALNCAWSWDSGFGFPIANTFFLFVNVDVVQEIGRRGIRVSPSSHQYSYANQHVPGRTCYVRRPSRANLSRIRSVLPPGPDGRPATPKGMSYFDTTVLYQAIARAEGFPVHRVRPLGGFGHLAGLPIQDESSDELLHIGAISKADVLHEFSTHFHSHEVYLLYLAAEYLVLEGASTLPEHYRRRLSAVTATLTGHGLSPSAAEDLVRRHLIHDRGMASAAADAVVRRPQR